VTDREARIARNEALFRQVNERIREVPLDAHPDELREFLCECGSAECTEAIQLTLSEYEEVRADPRKFAVLPGHLVSDVESVVAANERFVTVRKHPEESVVARATDPRNDR
jgi:hypothetical protein